MSGPPLAFVLCLALNYFDDFISGRPYWHKANIGVAAAAGTVCIIVDKILL